MSDETKSGTAPDPEKVARFWKPEERRAHSVGFSFRISHEMAAEAVRRGFDRAPDEDYTLAPFEHDPRTLTVEITLAAAPAPSTRARRASSQE